MEVPYLGFYCDSHRQAFSLLPAKKDKLITLVKSILPKDLVSVLSLQRLASKCDSLFLAVPGARLFTNEMNMAVSNTTSS